MQSFSLTVLLLVFAFGLTAKAQTLATTKPTVVKYLILGADPQAKDRQPTSDEEVVIIDQDICDPGWGTGSDKKVNGCYPKNSAVIRNKATGFVTAMYVCGNEPSEKHTIAGKVVPATELVLIPGPVGPAGKDGKDGQSIKGDPGSPGKDGIAPNLTFAEMYAAVHTSDNKVDKPSSVWKWIVGGGAIVGIAIVCAKWCSGSKGDNVSNIFISTGTAPTAPLGPGTITGGNSAP
ncbi:hypothetical protein A3B85_01865 [Candidatus Nomurabacteria bacterium RIFCSPHIGHO2_02_FULL_37_13]|uniref:Uncharacterized protein n=1 Tax=Candidatus Nomurabacteria bacterium RIFCSPHIGHO2_02_FULL_37_13 TaxID=1801750 RepID=A0A1F6W4H7_9BACT|nr:MAG: hypothetical protein A2640_02550 [Candidatus Nomurabacteria bacterium RIFCSPHIGHO2_01_FULL_36_23]OGI76838.1 MAG: hypothetical protein A3B85_01865 [Candidatus Nomurabacteria bacterium RIFCSPHIGHO2_02_FULL_37_13]OGI87808.1 MAG: hypothetical protein A2906_02135 [Candidatus Nomurabacteria bacterium RIFCSPLOWO2_01_FULL_37_25]